MVPDPDLVPAALLALVGDCFDFVQDELAEGETAAGCFGDEGEAFEELDKDNDLNDGDLCSVCAGTVRALRDLEDTFRMILADVFHKLCGAADPPSWEADETGGGEVSGVEGVRRDVDVVEDSCEGLWNCSLLVTELGDCHVFLPQPVLAFRRGPELGLETLEPK